MQRTRDEVMRVLHEQGAGSVAELATALGLSEGAIRRHMDIILAEGLVDATLERRGRGRPAVRYSLSEAGEERTAAHHYSRLLDRLYPALAELSQESVEGEPGSVVLEQVFEQIASDVARAYAPQVRSGELSERVEQVAETLREDGILRDVVDEGEVFRLRNVGCPYRSTARETRHACAADRRIIELLLDRPVEQVATAVDGSLTCEYLVSKLSPADAGASPEGGGASAVEARESQRKSRASDE